MEALGLSSLVSALAAGGPLWAFGGLLTGVLFWFLRRSLVILDTRLGAIAEKLGALASEHRAEVRELAEAHVRAVEALSRRNEELVGQIIDLARPRGPRE